MAEMSHRPVVEFVQPDLDSLVELGQAEEGVVA